MNNFLTDARVSIRMFLGSPGFTLTALGVLALGIGATTSIFSIVSALLLRPLPVPNSDRMVVLMSTWITGSGQRQSYADASPAKFAHWRAQSSVVEDVSAYLPGTMNFTGGEKVEQWRSMQVSVDFFDCWRIRVAAGRPFTSEEDRPGGTRVALISQELWTRRFDRDPQILGKAISLNGEPYSVVGVAGDSTALGVFGPTPEVYVAFGLDPNSRDEGTTSKLRPGLRRE